VIFAAILALLCGFVSLSYEIVWFRVVSYASEGAAPAFAWLLCAYLIGIGIGAAAARFVCRTGSAGDRGRTLRGLAHFIAASALAIGVPPLCGWMVAKTGLWEATLPVVCAAAVVLGACLPLIAHAAVPPERAGAGLGAIYFANILGSTAGSLWTGLVLLDAWPLWKVSLALSLASLAIAAGTLLAGRAARGWKAALALGLYAAAAIASASFARPLHDGLYERLSYKSSYRPANRFTHVVENKSGVITVDAQGQIYGNGVYDGAFNVALEPDINGIVRAYALGALHPSPREVLMVGLSSGSWATVVANHPAVHRLTVVEINPGYVQLLARFPMVAELRSHPKVQIEIDDARRWLVRNAGRRFDAIVANATFHHRASATNLLSSEWLTLVRAHLRPGGIYFFNTTNSPRVQRTAADAFPHVLRFMNFFVGSDRPVTFDEPALRRDLAAYVMGGARLFDPAREEDRARIDRITKSVLPYIERDAEIRARVSRFEPISDDNMGTEWEDRSSHPSTSPFAPQAR
jgi:spermidine synthase